MNYKNAKWFLSSILVIMSLAGCGGTDSADALMSKRLANETLVVPNANQILVDGVLIQIQGLVDSVVPANTELQRLIEAGITFTPRGCAIPKDSVDERGEMLISVADELRFDVLVLVAGKDVERAKTLGFVKMEGTAEDYFAQTFECSSHSL
jgi:hypothetical protein